MESKLDKKFTLIAMSDLDAMRKLVHDYVLPGLREVTGKNYFIRTFYEGPRVKRSSASTKKSNATGAKIGIYEVTGSHRDQHPVTRKYGTGKKRQYGNLVTYIEGYQNPLRSPKGL